LVGISKEGGRRITWSKLNIEIVHLEETSTPLTRLSKVVPAGTAVFAELSEQLVGFVLRGGQDVIEPAFFAVLVQFALQLPRAGPGAVQIPRLLLPKTKPVVIPLSGNQIADRKQWWSENLGKAGDIILSALVRRPSLVTETIPFSKLSQAALELGTSVISVRVSAHNPAATPEWAPAQDVIVSAPQIAIPTLPPFLAEMDHVDIGETEDLLQPQDVHVKPRDTLEEFLSVLSPCDNLAAQIACTLSPKQREHLKARICACQNGKRTSLSLAEIAADLSCFRNSCGIPLDLSVDTNIEHRIWLENFSVALAAGL
jgi:hypothetical protein